MDQVSGSKNPRVWVEQLLIDAARCSWSDDLVALRNMLWAYGGKVGKGIGWITVPGRGSRFVGTGGGWIHTDFIDADLNICEASEDVVGVLVCSYCRYRSVGVDDLTAAGITIFPKGDIMVIRQRVDREYTYWKNGVKLAAGLNIDIRTIAWRQMALVFQRLDMIP